MRLLVITALAALAIGVKAGNVWHHSFSEDAEWVVTTDTEFEETCTFIKEGGGDMMNRHGNALTDKLKQNGASDKTIILVKQQIPPALPRW